MGCVWAGPCVLGPQKLALCLAVVGLSRAGTVAHRAQPGTSPSPDGRLDQCTM